MKRILVCDDDPVTLNVVYMKFTKEGLGEVIRAGDGKQGIDFVSQNHFDLIITDLQMPYQSGIDLARHVRKVLKKNIPIIVLSSEGLEHVVLEAFQVGVNDFINKPFSPKELIEKAKNLL